MSTTSSLPEKISATSSGGRPARKLTGPEKAAIILLILGESYGQAIWEDLEDEEIRVVSLAMSQLGSVDADLIEKLMMEFVSKMSAAGSVTGDFDRTAMLLGKHLPKERAETIMAEIRGPAGRNMWQKLGNVQDEMLAAYLKNEYPQTVAVVLSKLKPEHAARVLAILPEDFATDIVGRMLKMENVQKDVLERIEETLRVEFISNLSMSHRRDAHELMAEIFNSFDRQTETRFLTALDDLSRESAARIRSLMFTFDDLTRLDPASIQTLMRSVDKNLLGVAMKGAVESTRAFFMSNMSTRAARNLEVEMSARGPVRLKEVDDAQTKIVNIAKDLAAKGEILISKNRAEDELIY
jgi:flagellar motor switch protein FliG